MFEVRVAIGHQGPVPLAPPSKPAAFTEVPLVAPRPPVPPIVIAMPEARRQAPARRQRPQSWSGARRRPLLVLTLMFAALAAALAVNVLSGPRKPGAAGLASVPFADSVLRFAGFGIDEVTLTGHKFTSDSDIYAALDLENAKTLASFDTSGVRSRLERLPWIATAELTRVWPNRLDVRITERKAFAVWSRGDRDYLIDNSGRVLSAVNRGSSLGLPVFAGEGAATEAQALWTLINRYPDIASRLEEAVRVGERRWTLKLAGGVTLVLPADREAPALEELTSGGDLAGLLGKGNRIVDLRAEGRVTLRTGTIGPRN